MTDLPVRDSAYQLLWPGTRVVLTTAAGHTRHGEVEDYEHHRPGQTEFPVRFGDSWRLATSLDVRECTECPQPPDRVAPRRTGPWSYTPVLSASALPQQRATSPTPATGSTAVPAA